LNFKQLLNKFNIFQAISIQANQTSCPTNRLFYCSSISCK